MGSGTESGGNAPQVDMRKPKQRRDGTRHFLEEIADRYRPSVGTALRENGQRYGKVRGSGRVAKLNESELDDEES